MKVIMILVLLILISCSNTPSKRYGTRHKRIDDRAVKYVKKFEQYYKRKIPSHIIIKFRDLPNNAGGLCNTIKDIITIDTPIWNKKDVYEREEVVFHELGHCVLSLDHDYNIKEGTTCPISIMYFKGATVKGCYRKHRSYYIKELFFRAKNGKTIYRR